MILNIRGGLGTQVLELMIGVAKAGVRNEIIDEIHINTGGNVVDTVRFDYISPLFSIPVPIIVTSNTLKQNVWTEEHFEMLAEFDPGAPRTLLKFNKPYKANVISKFFNKEPDNSVIHVRGKDRQVASEWNYQILISRAIDFMNNIEILGDDQALISRITCGYGRHIRNVSSDPMSDFIRCIKSDVLLTSFSSFTIAAMMFDPKKHFRFLSKETVSGPHKMEDKHYRCVDILMKKKFTNGEYV